MDHDLVKAMVTTGDAPQDPTPIPHGFHHGLVWDHGTQWGNFMKLQKIPSGRQIRRHMSSEKQAGFSLMNGVIENMVDN